MAHTPSGGKQIWGTQLSANDSTQQEELGIIRESWDSTDSVFKRYMYVQFDAGTADNAASAGDVLLFYDATGYTVTNDVSDASVTQFAGIAIGALTDEYYGWIQVGPGFCNNISTDSGVVDGDALVPHSSDGQADTMADGEEEQVFGVALADDSSNTLSDAWLR